MGDSPRSCNDVDTPELVQQAVAHLAGALELAVDVEADAMHAFRPRLCFVQVASETEIFLFDTLAEGVSAQALGAVFADPSRTKFFHAAGGDLQYLAAAGVRVKGLFDTHRAATLLGWLKVGLADLVAERLKITLSKAHQQSDFSLRPLPTDMRSYIADDVRYLVEIGRQVREECLRHDILEEVLLDCERACDEAQSLPEVGTDFRPRIPRSGMSVVRQGLALAIAQELHARRLRWAEAANVPMGRMLSNAAVTAISVAPPTTLKELAQREGVRGPFVRQHGDEVLELLRGLVEQSTRGELALPARAESRDPARKKREERLKELRAKLSAQRKVTPSVVLPNALVDDLARLAPPSLEALAQVPYFGEKRLRLHGDAILKALRQAGQ